MLHLHFAPTLDLLVEELLPEVRRIWTDPFASPDILVPSPTIGKWLRMRFADGMAGNVDGAHPVGCVANLRLPTIEKYLWNLLKPYGYRQLDQQCLQQIICALLDEACINQNGFEPVRTYLSGMAGIDPLKRVQLAAHTAHQFLEYEYNRPGVWRKEGRWDPQGIDGIWMHDRRYTDDGANEPWQAELYRRVRKCIAVFAAKEGNSGEKYLSLPQLYRLRREAVTPSGASIPIDPATVFMFGVTKVSHFHRNLFVEISQADGVDLHVYLTNPCAEFWEDVNTSRRRWRRTWNRSSADAGIRPRTPDDFNRAELSELSASGPPEDQRLLELWGGAGKENIFLWCQDAEWNFDYRSPGHIDNEEPPVSILRSLQNSLLRREKKMVEPDGGWQPDGSLRILACPDRGREIEEIREQVLDLIRNGTLQTLNEAVVYLTDPSAYMPCIQRVFGRFPPYHPEYIPFCILGAAGRNTAFSQGITLFLEIARSRFDRAHLFGLLRNPLVQATRNIAPESVAVWEQWADALSMFRGYDREHRKAMGDTGLTLTDVHTFEFGMARMLLVDLSEGAAVLNFMQQGPGAAPDGGAPVPVLPYRDFETSDRKMLETYCGTVESLYFDGRRLREDVDDDVGKGLETFRELVNKWMGKIPDKTVIDAAAEGSMLRSFYDALSSLHLQKSIAGRERIPFEEFAHLALGCLPEEPAAGSGAWTGGITFAPLRPSMVVPHETVFVAGLDDVLFPGANRRPSWDLLSRKRIIGDSDRVRDNRFAFLELLHAARKRLLLSYRAKDMQKESELHPSSVVQELESYLIANGIFGNNDKGKRVCTLKQEIPWIVHESLDAAAAVGREHGTWSRTEINLSRLAGKERKKHRYDLAAATTVALSDTAILRVTLYDLRRFFSNPLEYHLTRTLGIELEESAGTVSVTDEPLDSGNLAIATMQKEIWTSVLRRAFPEKPDDAADDDAFLSNIAAEEARRLYTRHTASGCAPEAMPERMERDFLLKWASGCIGPVRMLRKMFSDHQLIENSDLSLERDGIAGMMNVPLENGAVCSVECRHRLVLLPRRRVAAGRAGIIAVRKEGKAIDNPDLWLEGALQWLSEKKIVNHYGVALVQLNRGDGKNIKITADVKNMIAEDPGAIKEAGMTQWLSGLIYQIKVLRSSEHLPFAEIRKFWSNLSCGLIADDLDSKYSAYHSHIPAFKLVDARVPELSEDQLNDLARSRYAPMLDGEIIEKGDAE